MFGKGPQTWVLNSVDFTDRKALGSIRTNNRISEEETVAGSYLIAWINMEHTEGCVIGKGTHRRY